MAPTILVIVLIVVVGVSVLAYRNRPSRGIESGISSFRRELRALAPESDEGPRAAEPRDDPPSTSGVGVLRPDPGAEPAPGDDAVTDDRDGTDDTDDTDGDADGRTD